MTPGTSSYLIADSLEDIVIPLYVFRSLYFAAKLHVVGERRRKRNFVILALIVEGEDPVEKGLGKPMFEKFNS